MTWQTKLHASRISKLANEIEGLETLVRDIQRRAKAEFGGEIRAFGRLLQPEIYNPIVAHLQEQAERYRREIAALKDDEEEAA